MPERPDPVELIRQRREDARATLCRAEIEIDLCNDLLGDLGETDPSDDPPERACRECGCTDAHACTVNGEPCHWVGDDLCSACVKPDRLQEALADVQPRISEPAAPAPPVKPTAAANANAAALDGDDLRLVTLVRQGPKSRDELLQKLGLHHKTVDALIRRAAAATLIRQQTTHPFHWESAS